MAAILKIIKIAISQQWFDRSSRYLVCCCERSLLTATAAKTLNFQNPRWRTAAILKKNVKSLFICHSSTDLDEI